MIHFIVNKTGILYLGFFLFTFLLEYILISFAILYKREFKERKIYTLYNRYKLCLFISMLLMGIVLLVLSQNAIGWDKLAYIVPVMINFTLLISIFVVNNIIRIYFRIRYKQKFDFKNIFKQDKVLKVIILILIYIYQYSMSNAII